MKLYSYFRSSCSYRLRIALNLKGLDYEYIAVNLLGGEQRQPEYRALNPLGLVPAIELAPGEVVGQSIALLEWLEETHPEPPLLPADALDRARVRSLVNTIACDIQPICNIGIANYLQAEHELSGEALQHWYSTWMHRGFRAVEHQLAGNGSTFCCGEQPGMGDIVLVPQVYNARRMHVTLEPFPNIVRVADTCNALAAFAEAAPERQPDSTL
jgi:maleylacetoacetate isomerase